GAPACRCGRRVGSRGPTRAQRLGRGGGGHIRGALGAVHLAGARGASVCHLPRRSPSRDPAPNPAPGSESPAPLPSRLAVRRAAGPPCRPRCAAGLEAVPSPAPAEARLLQRIGAPPDVRLACQTRPTADVEIFPLLPPFTGVTEQLLKPGYVGSGTERELVVL